MVQVKKNIAILFGGDSAEYVISEKSAGQVYNILQASAYQIFMIRVKENHWALITEDGQEYPVDLNDFSVSRNDKTKIFFDFAFIIIHGTPGEDGKLQAFLDMHKVPYNTPGVFVSALTFNKYACKLYLRNFHVLTPEAVLHTSGQDIFVEAIIRKTGLPCFVKPNNGGSSFGTTKVLKQEDLKDAVQEAMIHDKEVIIESFVKGTELSCGVLKTKSREYIFPVTEIVPKNDFFDYEAKYIAGMADEIVPARIEQELQEKCQSISSEIYDHLGCKGLVRMDFILRGNQIFFLEVNIVPGMSQESIVPKMIRANGYSEREILEAIIGEGLTA